MLWYKEFMMIMSPTLSGIFFLALGVDTGIHRKGGALMGLRVLFDHNVATEMYIPEKSTQLVIGLFFVVAAPIIYIHHRFGPKNEWPWTERRLHHSKHLVQQYTYLTFSQLQRTGSRPSDVESDMLSSLALEPRQPKKIYHRSRVRKRDISVPLPFVTPTSHFIRYNTEFPQMRR